MSAEQRPEAELETPETALGAALMRLMEATNADARVVEDPRGSAALVVREGARLLPGSDVVVCATAKDGEIEVLAASGGLSEPLAGVRGTATGGAVGRAITSKAAVEVDDPSNEPVLGPILSAAGMRRMRVSPLLSRGLVSQDVVGAFVVARHDQRPLREAECMLLDAYASMVAMSLVRQEQRSEAERSARRWALGVDIALDLGAAQEPEDLNRRILARALDALEADRATLLRLDGGDLVVEATQDVDGRPVMPGFRTPIRAQPVMLEALETRRMVRGLVETATFPQQLRDALSGGAQAVTLPLVLAGDVIGFLNVHRRCDLAFDAEDADTLQLIGNVASVTLRNAHLLADTQSAKQAMTEFLHVVVHEMRAPLTIIGGYVSMVQEGIFGEPPAAYSRPLDAVSAKVREAQHLVDELLFAARLESGSLPYQVEDVDLGDSAERAVQRAQPRAQLLRAVVEARVPETARARADSAHVDRILDNLINNALTYGGDPAHVVVATTAGADPALTVDDNGDGVAPMDRAHLFERFYRGRSKSAGSGLGLFISRQLAETWGGTLDLESDNGDGARFVLRLPAAAFSPG
jgi:signal transduction histidine kinase